VGGVATFDSESTVDLVVARAAAHVMAFHAVLAAAGGAAHVDWSLLNTLKYKISQVTMQSCLQTRTGELTCMLNVCFGFWILRLLRG
jgi:hypothetical protein